MADLIGKTETKDQIYCHLIRGTSYIHAQIDAKGPKHLANVISLQNMTKKIKRQTNKQENRDFSCKKFVQVRTKMTEKCH